MVEVLTIGHSNHSLERFLGLLTRHGVAAVADTRSYPASKYAPHFNRDPLRTALEQRGIAYLYFGRELGGRAPAPPEVFGRGIAALAKEITGRRVAILCAEENPSNCHRRSLITPALIGAGFAVRHIRGDGQAQTEEQLAETENAQHSLF